MSRPPMQAVHDEEPWASAAPTVSEPDLSWPPAAVACVDPAEVPEVDAFFFRRRMAVYRALAFVGGVLLVTLAGLATATAKAYHFEIGVEAPGRTGARGASPSSDAR